MQTIRISYLPSSIPVFLLALFAVICPAAHAQPAKRLAAGNGLQWYKGNTHTHTLWSDGDAAPEWAVAWYKEHGYGFLSLTDHNVIMQGLHLFHVDADSRLTPERLQLLKDKFGEDSVDTWDVTDYELVMKLLTYDELCERFEEPGKFLLIQGEEITGETHVNVLNVRELINESKAGDNLASMKAQVDEANAQRDKLGLPMLAHINHANFAQAISAEDLAAVPQARYVEVYNGHGDVRNWGDESLRIPPMDKKWDIALTLRLMKDPADMLFGVATDDAHDYWVRGAGHAIPGRGWCMVLADKLDTDSIMNAFLRGDFYASAGVLLDEIAWDEKTLRVTPQAEPGVTYTTQFYGTRAGFTAESRPATDGSGVALPNRTRIYSDKVGALLFETTDVPAVYEFKGDELYVRAKVVSSRLKADPFREGDLEMAWTQPVVP